ncbi:MAG: hypothetical protein PVF74_11655 [Anaerolineales bacterium]
MNIPEINLDLSITEVDADDERLDNLTYQLMQELRDLGAESVERPEDEQAPGGSKGNPFTIGALALVALPAVLPSIVSFSSLGTTRGKQESEGQNSCRPGSRVHPRK